MTEPGHIEQQDKSPGHHALRWEDVTAERVDFDGLYYLAESFAVPFDPDRDWQEGDVIPRRLLREGEGSRGDSTQEE